MLTIVTQKKTLFLSVLILLVIAGCKNAESYSLPPTSMSIEDPVRYYHPVLQGNKQTIDIKITNTGKETLKIFKVLPSCGCTIATFDKGGIAPEEEGIISLEYDSNKNIGKVGIYTTIVANTKEKYHTVFFETNVVPGSLYTKDYEEIHLEEENNKKDNVIGKGYTVQRVSINNEVY